MFKEYSLLPGYSFGDEGFEPLFIYCDNTNEGFDIRNRPFKDIDHSFCGLITRYINSSPSKVHILDLGCGTFALSAQQIADIFQDKVTVTAVDVAMHSDLADTENFKCKLEDACKLSIPDDSVDLIYTWQFLFRLNSDRQKEALSEIARVLKPGGMALIDEDVFCFLDLNSPEILELGRNLGVKIHFITGPVSKPKYSRNEEDELQMETTRNFLVFIKPQELNP